MAGLGEQEKEPGDVARLVLSKRSPTFCSRYLRPLGLHQTPPPQAPGKLEGQAQDQAKGGGVLGGHADRQLLASPTRWSTYIPTPRMGVRQTEGRKEGRNRINLATNKNYTGERRPSRLTFTKEHIVP